LFLNNHFPIDLAFQIRCRQRSIRAVRTRSSLGDRYDFGAVGQVAADQETEGGDALLGDGSDSHESEAWVSWAEPNRPVPQA
jgi:hypothetical protein